MAVTLQAARQALGYALDDLEWHLASGGGANTATVPELISAASSASTGRVDGRWVFNATKGLQRRARNGGFTASTGTVTVDPTWTTPTNGDRIDFTSIFPCDGPEPSYRSILNLAGSKLLMPDWESLTIIPESNSYTLFAAPWLDRPERFGWPFPQPDGSPYPLLMERAPVGSGWVPADWRGPRILFQVGAAVLELDVPLEAGSSGTLRLNTMRTMSSWIGVAGTFANSTVGFVNESDQMNVSERDLVIAAVYEAVKILAKRGVSSASGRWADKLETAEREARALRFYDDTLEKAAPPPATPRVA